MTLCVIRPDYYPALMALRTTIRANIMLSPTNHAPKEFNIIASTSLVVLRELFASFWST